MDGQTDRQTDFLTLRPALISPTQSLLSGVQLIALPRQLGEKLGYTLLLLSLGSKQHTKLATLHKPSNHWDNKKNEPGSYLILKLFQFQSNSTHYVCGYVAEKYVLTKIFRFWYVTIQF